MLSRTNASGASSSILDQECGKLIRKRSTASNSSTRSFTSAASSSCPSSISSIGEFNNEQGTCMSPNQYQHPHHHIYQEPSNHQHYSPNHQTINFNSTGFKSGEEFHGMGVGGNNMANIYSGGLNNSMCYSDPIQNYYTSSSSSNRINIDKDEMKKYFNAPQVLAARMLNVSVSTLKRRYYEMYKSRWPYQRLSNSERKKSIWYYVNEEDEAEKYISSESLKTLMKAFEDPTVQITKVKQVKEKQPGQSQRQFLSYIPPSEKTKRYDDMNLSQISDSTQIKGGSRQKYFLIGGKSRGRGNKY